jgi:thioredoxin 1
MKTEITENDIDKVFSNNELVVIDFWASWCGPCKMLLPTIEELSIDYENDSKVGIYKINVDENRNISSKHNIRSIPAVLFFKNGVEIDRFIGYKNKEVIREMIENFKK